MRKKFNFGKIAYCGTRKINPVEVEIELKDTKDGPEFTASGVIYNQRKTDCYCAGQCLDEIYMFKKCDPVFNEIYRLWKRWHLNNMRPGNAEQEAAVREWEAAGNKYDYDKVCEYLKSINLYEDIYQGKPYKYGHGWCYEEIPANDLEIIKNLLN